MPISPKTLRRLALAARYLPRLARVRRRTWIRLAIALPILLLVLFFAFVWAVFALLAWLWSQGTAALG
jgi:fatty acid desaturase